MLVSTSELENIAPNNSVLVYHCVLATQQALSSLELQDYNQQSRQLAVELAQARQKGSKTLAANIAQQLEELFAKHICEKLLVAAGSGPVGVQQADNIAKFLSDCSMPVAGYCVFANHLQLLFILEGECSPPDFIEELKQHGGLADWHAGAWIRQVPAAQIMQKCHYLAELGKLDCALAATQASKRQQHDLLPQDAAPTDFSHISVLAEQSLEVMQKIAGGLQDKLVVDCTLGGGGHSELFLAAGARVIGIDQDISALQAASLRLQKYGSHFTALHGNFGQIGDLLANIGIEHVDGIFADIGVSSHQIDTAERGFSFMKPGPLDMRMNPLAKLTAAHIVNTYSTKQLTELFYLYGEERFSAHIARKIEERRAKQAFRTTNDLADFIASITRRKDAIHPATRCFQALRIAVNDELGVLDRLLQQAPALLSPKGVIAIISFHSLEDRLVKKNFLKHAQPTLDRPEWPAPRPNPDYCYLNITKKPLVATEVEIKLNSRSRSAKLRAAQRV